ncbi:MAG: hypothetical protein E6Q97_35210 [Desulfurellales bacterium]|nr:MAG: hypothetical protein E6Q97_35210 [Desulfurellales bacterium]
MTTLVLGDLHVGNLKFCGGPLRQGLNDRARAILQSVEDCVRYFVQNCGVTSVVQLGDFFDQPRPSPALVDASLHMIRATGVPWHILAGNHDLASHDAPSALAPMNHVEGVYIYEKASIGLVDGLPWAMCPYTGPSAEDALQELLEAIKGHPTPVQHGAVHYGLVDSRLTELRTDLVTKDSMQRIFENQYTYLFFGHEHNSRVSAGRWVSLGGFTHTGFGDTEVPCVGLVSAKGTSLHAWRGTSRFCSNFRSVCLDRGMLRWLLADMRAHWPGYYLIHQAHEEVAKALVEAGLIAGYKLWEAGENVAEELEAYEPSSAPMDAVYEVLAEVAPQDVIEEVFALVEEDMKS